MKVQTEHPNISIVQQFLETMPNDFKGAAAFVSEDFVWHYFNPRVRELEGNYRGISGVKAFFEKLQTLAQDTFEVQPISIAAFGNEFVVSHANLELTLESMQIKTDAIIVWRVHKDKIFEAWDLPAVLALPVTTESLSFRG